MTPPPDGDHEKYISRVLRQLVRRSPVDMDASGTKGLKAAGTAVERLRNHLIPDLTFAPLGFDLETAEFL